MDVAAHTFERVLHCWACPWLLVQGRSIRFTLFVPRVLLSLPISFFISPLVFPAAQLLCTPAFSFERPPLFPPVLLIRACSILDTLWDVPVTSAGGILKKELPRGRAALLIDRSAFAPPVSVLAKHFERAGVESKRAIVVYVLFGLLVFQ